MSFRYRATQPDEYADKEDIIISLLQQILQRLDEQREAEMVTIGGRVVKLSHVLLALALPASPAVTHETTVAVNPDIIAENDSQPLLRYEIFNDDPAQSIFLGPGQGVTVQSGRRLPPQQAITYIVPRGGKIYAVCAVATVSARISDGEDILGRIRSAGG